METKITINGKDPYDCTKEEIFAAWDQPSKNEVIMERLRRLICKLFKHKYHNFGTYGPESGEDYIVCTRCGKELLHYIYY